MAMSEVSEPRAASGFKLGDKQMTCNSASETTQYGTLVYLSVLDI
jgi:hypothetical protein